LIGFVARISERRLAYARQIYINGLEMKALRDVALYEEVGGAVGCKLTTIKHFCELS
jgi:hypothetical protein